MPQNFIYFGHSFTYSSQYMVMQLEKSKIYSITLYECTRENKHYMIVKMVFNHKILLVC